MNHELQEGYNTRGFCAIRKLLNQDEVALLREDAQKLLEALTARGGDLFEEACVLDPVPCGMPERHAARTSITRYMEMRQAQANHSRAHSDALKELLVSKLPAVIASVGAHHSFLFNEQHVVKPTGENTSFAWHTVRLTRVLRPEIKPTASSAHHLCTVGRRSPTRSSVCLATLFASRTV